MSSVVRRQDLHYLLKEQQRLFRGKKVKEPDSARLTLLAGVTECQLFQLGFEEV